MTMLLMEPSPWLYVTEVMGTDTKRTGPNPKLNWWITNDVNGEIYHFTLLKMLYYSSYYSIPFAFI